MTLEGFEPCPTAWQASILPLSHIFLPWYADCDVTQRYFKVGFISYQSIGAAWRKGRSLDC